MSSLRSAFLQLLIAASFIWSASGWAQAKEIRYAELEVMAAFLSDHNARLPDEKSWVIASTTAVLPSAFNKDASRELRNRMPEASRAVIADLVRVGGKSVSFNIPRSLVNAEVSFSLADKDFLHEVFESGSRENPWGHFFVRYPAADGLVRFSRVGLDPNNRQALIFVEYTCGALCGSGYTVLLRYESGRWKIIRSNQIWVS